jgi:hypothetical protein
MLGIDEFIGRSLRKCIIYEHEYEARVDKLAGHDDFLAGKYASIIDIIFDALDEYDVKRVQFGFFLDLISYAELLVKDEMGEWVTRAYDPDEFKDECDYAICEALESNPEYFEFGSPEIEYECNELPCKEMSYTVSTDGHFVSIFRPECVFHDYA